MSLFIIPSNDENTADLLQLQSMENDSLSLQSLYDVRSFIMNSEGFSAKAYRDTKGLLTIGYGFNL
jgi:hypothetical protein